MASTPEPISVPPLINIPQTDGNTSFLDTSSSKSTSASLSSLCDENILSQTSWFSQNSVVNLETQQRTFISVRISDRTDKAPPENRQPNLKVIRRNDKCIDASNLPVIASFNMRSLWSKLNCLADEILERDVEICFLSEVWEEKENKMHAAKIEELYEMKNIIYFSTPRPGTKRGGGAALAFHSNNFSVAKLTISIPKPLEVVWALVKPLKPVGKVTKIIVCSFYSPPNSRKNKQLVEHIANTYNDLKLQHPDASIIISGDKNNLDETTILSLSPQFRQIVSRNTRKNNLLTIIITDLHMFFKVPLIIPPVPVDDGAPGVPSDHDGVLALPLRMSDMSRGTESRTYKIRPMPQSLVMQFGSSLVEENWSFLETEKSPTELVTEFENFTSEMVMKHFPEKTITVTNYDKPYITQELKKLRRQRQRVYRKFGKCKKYIDLRNQFDLKLKIEANKYQEKIKDEIRQGNISNSYKALRKLEFGPSVDNSSFQLPEQIENNWTTMETAENLADFFCKISQEFDPICTSRFSPRVKEKLENGKVDASKPVLDEWMVYKKIVAAKKPKTVLQGDLPVKIVKEFSPELAKPVTLIFNRITNTGEYPRQWVTEYQVAIPKVRPPQSLDDLRNISSTAFLSKVYESFLGQWLFPYIEPFLDPGQCGGLKGSSITHYLVRLLHFTHKFLDKRDPYSVLLALIDLEKAFNRVSHQLVIEDLSDMNVPGWILQILVSYLTDRSMYMRYQGQSSSKKLLPGSCPQGAYLGILLFIIIFNGALLRPSIPRHDSLNLKYIDDLSLLQAINLKTALADDPVTRPFPLTFCERTMQILPSKNNPLQASLIDLEHFATEKLLKIKEKKTNIMKFCNSRNSDFPVEVMVPGFQNNLEVVSQTKLLGVIISDDLKWAANTSYICEKASKRLWILRRMKVLAVDPVVILDVYLKEVRSILELAVPAWHSGLTRKQSAEIERIQRIAVNIILCKPGERNKLSYRKSIDVLGLDSLEKRRLKLCENFAKKTLKSRHSDLFQENHSSHNTRCKRTFVEHKTSSERAFMSPLVFLTRLLNKTM